MNQPAPDNTSPLPPPGKLIATAEVISLADHAAKRAEKLGTVIAGLEAGIARRGEEAAASAAAAGFPPMDQKAAAAKLTVKARAEVVANSEDARWGYIKEVNAAAESVALTAALFASPQAVLARAGLGSPERTHFQTQLDGSGIVEIKNMAALAVATNNKVLGAAIMSVVDRMPRRERPLSTAELADRLVGEETRQVQDAITKIKLAAQSAINLNREFYGAGDDDDPWSEETWLKANPALGDFRSLDDVQRQAAQAKRMPAAEQGFRNLILNQRVDAHVRFLAKAEWDANGGAVDFDALVGRECWGGLDLSQSRDLTALVLVFPDDDGGFDVLPRFFLPERGIRDKAELDRVPYDLWAKQGFLTLIPGAVVDPSFVADTIAEYCDTYGVQRIAYDRWRIEDLKRELDRIGAEPPLEPFGQGFRDMAPALDKMERLVAEAQLRHAGNPILTFCASNAVVEMDPAGNRKLAKNKSSGRIDGMVALAMALAAVDREGDEAMPACLAELI